MDFEIEISRLSSNNMSEAFLIEKSNFTPPFGLDDLSSYSKKGFSLVAKADGKVVGYILSETVADECQIMKVATHADFRRKGIAKRLIEELSNICKGCGAKKVFLEVRASNTAATELYGKTGFTKIYIRKGYYSDPVEDAIVMQKAL
jgi:ribosomal-protein-alanine N-acetyltransferase